MANIKELKKKIKSTKSTLKITQAMKLVSAAKLNRAQIAIESARPYALELEDMIKTISALSDGYDHEFLNEKKNNSSLLLVISSDKGLCGGYNSRLNNKVSKFIEESDEDIKVCYIGKKVRDLLAGKVNAGKTFTFEKADPSFQEVQAIASELGEAFGNGEVGKVYVAYNIFHSAIEFESSVKQVLPIALDHSEKEILSQKFAFDFQYDPNAGEILDALIPEAYVSSIYTCILDGAAAEHGSRMAAMDSAVGNCEDAIKELTIKTNKLRQAAITTELIEVISGAESLNG
jgi:F-type H+-transporting ATPase subunit gamma